MLVEHLSGRVRYRCFFYFHKGVAQWYSNSLQNCDFKVRILASLLRYRSQVAKDGRLQICDAWVQIPPISLISYHSSVGESTRLIHEVSHVRVVVVGFFTLVA